MCGIGGIISASPRPFNYTAFCALGVINDARGGDSCGVFIDGKYYYGIKEKKYFSDAFKDMEILNNTDTSQIALVHCRKASVGAIDHSTAQPVIIAPEGKVEFVLLHNGTIYNYEELAKKYIPDVDIKGMTDSQVMAQIFYYKGYDALDEYEGSAAFAIVDYRKEKPQVLFYHGKSKDYSYSKEDKEERPLYFLIDKKEKTLYFSSIYQILETFVKDEVAYVLPYNTLCEFDEDCLRSVRKVDRSNVFQKKQYVAAQGNYYTNYGVGSYSSSFFTSYITCNSISNTYCIEGKPIFGKKFISNFGRVEDKKINGNTEVYFYKGYLLANQKAFTFLTTLTASLKITPEEFVKKYINLIAYLSFDRIYYDDEAKLWKKATNWNTAEVYTGKYQQITSTVIRQINNGVMSNINSYDRNLCPYEIVDKGIKFKEILKAIKNESNT